MFPTRAHHTTPQARRVDFTLDRALHPVFEAGHVHGVDLDVDGAHFEGLGEGGTTSTRPRGPFEGFILIAEEFLQNLIIVIVLFGLFSGVG